MSVNAVSAGVTNLQLGASQDPFTGTPLAVFHAKVGSRFSRTDGGAGTSSYVKESATDATGWVGK